MNDRRGSSSPGWPALVLLLIAPLARGEVLQGQVFLDANANGLLDPTEHGVAGVALSNGREVVRSDKSGRYQIALDIGDTLFLITHRTDLEPSCATPASRQAGPTAFSLC